MVIGDGDMVNVNNSRDIINTKTVAKRICDLTESLDALKQLRENFPGTPIEWSAGAILIKDEFFEDHIKQIVAEQLTESAWLLPHIDWVGAVSFAIKNYLSVNFDGVTYWVKKENTQPGA